MKRKSHPLAGRSVGGQPLGVVVTSIYTTIFLILRNFAFVVVSPLEKCAEEKWKVREGKCGARRAREKFSLSHKLPRLPREKSNIIIVIFDFKYKLFTYLFN